MNRVYFLVTKPNPKLGNIPAAQTLVTNPISKLESNSAAQTLKSIPAPRTLENISVCKNSEDIPAEQNSSDCTRKIKGPDQFKYQSRNFWNADMEKDLIRLAKKEDHLWNIKHEKYHRRNCKILTMDRVAKEMSSLWPDHTHLFNYKSCLTKLRYFKNYYRIERSKVEKTKSSRKLYKSQWIHFNDFSFLDNYYKMLENDASDSPITTQNPSKTDTSQDTTGEDEISRMPEEASADEACHENMDEGTSYSDCQTEEITTTAKTKVSRQKALHSNSFSKARSPHKYPSSSKLKAAPTKKSKQSVDRVVKLEPKLWNREKRVEMSLDDAFGSFIGKDMAKIPEGKHKEQLRFQIMELIHCVKMNEDIMFE